MENSSSESGHDDIDQEIRWARNFVGKRIEESQWRLLQERLKDLEDRDGQTPRVYGVLWLGDPNCNYSAKSWHSLCKPPPMPLTQRNRARLAAIGFHVTGDGYWAVYSEK